MFCHSSIFVLVGDYISRGILNDFHKRPINLPQYSISVIT